MMRIAIAQRSKISSVSVPSRSFSRLNASNINPHLVQADYAVRGLLYLKSTEYQQVLNQQKVDGKKLLPFDEIIACNIGNPQALNQKPLTFHRQVCALLEWPEILTKAGIEKFFATDAISRAKFIMSQHPIGVGSYSDSRGVEIVRKWVAEFIEKRDGHPSDPTHIFLSDGASSAIAGVLRCIIRDKNDGILIPRPQYPLYSATITLLGGSQLSYDLNEQSGWSLSIEDLANQVQAAKKQGINPRALVIINPGNPTGQCLGESNLKGVVEFCAKNEIVLLADEVYQENIYTEQKFISFKKILMESPYKSAVQLFSFHSVSKGFLGECGKRGGYMEMTNIHQDVIDQLYKLSSISLCSNLMGQIMVGLMVKPPAKGEESYELYEKEKNDVLSSLKRRAEKLSHVFNTLPNISCSKIQGALYAFPSVHLPPKAVEEAKKNGLTADTFYSLCLLKETGLVVVPGNGFGQKDQTYHFRTTFLPPEEKFDGIINRFRDFHNSFMKTYTS